MKILVIDDIRIHHSEVHYARNLEEARLKAFNEPWDEVWLDNDLGGEEEVIEIVKEIEKMYYDGITLPIKKFVVHTSNPVAAQRMIDTLLPMPYRLARVKASDFFQKVVD